MSNGITEIALVLEDGSVFEGEAIGHVPAYGIAVGEVVSWTPSSHKLALKDNTTTLLVGDTIVGANGASYDISSIVDVLSFDNDGNAQNKVFEDDADNYLDFSETNPFGEVT